MSKNNGEQQEWSGSVVRTGGIGRSLRDGGSCPGKRRGNSTNSLF